MKYYLKTEAVVEAPSAEAAKNLVQDRANVVHTSVHVTPAKEWLVRVSVPVLYTFEMPVNAETASEAERLALDEIEMIDEVEDFVRSEIVTDYQADVDSQAAEVQSVEAVEDEEEETDTEVPVA